MHDSKIKDYPDLIRKETGGIINTNDGEYTIALSRKKQRERFNSMERRIDKLSTQMEEIHQLLTRLCNDNSKIN